eukprot:3459021-Rhodomonas_salina.2
MTTTTTENQVWAERRSDADTTEQKKNHSSALAGSKVEASGDWHVRAYMPLRPRAGRIQSKHSKAHHPAPPPRLPTHPEHPDITTRQWCNQVSSGTIRMGYDEREKGGELTWPVCPIEFAPQHFMLPSSSNWYQHALGQYRKARMTTGGRIPRKCAWLRRTHCGLYAPIPDGVTHHVSTKPRVSGS